MKTCRHVISCNRPLLLGETLPACQRQVWGTLLWNCPSRIQYVCHIWAEHGYIKDSILFSYLVSVLYLSRLLQHYYHEFLVKELLELYFHSITTSYYHKVADTEYFHIYVYRIICPLSMYTLFYTLPVPFPSFLASSENHYIFQSRLKSWKIKILPTW